ncbi:MAG: hypothetical protein JNJ54_30365 [Myxococcaceae bacterium]|nr:hypothetical protein [Myxococcaceae bacterium]
MHARGQALASAAHVPEGAVAGFLVTHLDGGLDVRWTDADGGHRHGAARFTLGVEPLVQLAVETADGRLQVPPIGWGRDAGWVALRSSAGDWRGPAFSWNGACAPCHATGFRVGALGDGGFESRWSALSVSCAACHGDAAGHRQWVEAGRPAADAAGFARSLRQRARFSFDDGGAIAKGTGVAADQQTLACAPCHSRRRALIDGDEGADFFDRFEPELMRPAAFAFDGRALDEVYEAGPFLMSRMHGAGVRCSDCHDPHRGGLRAQGDALCARCHRESTFATTTHHQHPRGAVSCASCHLPTVTVLGVDGRHDHSLRRPGREVCLGCHQTLPPTTARLRVEEEATLAFEAVAKERVDAAWRLARVSSASRVSSFELASLLALRTGPWTGADVELLSRAARGDDWLRYGAARALVHAPAGVRREVGLALLRDVRRAVRVQAGRALAADGVVPPGLLLEVETAEQVNAFRGEAWLTRSELARARGDDEQAQRLLEEGLWRQPDFVPLAVNLADLRRGEAVALLAAAAEEEGPWQQSAAYALGLARWRVKDRAGAVAALSAAARDGSPRHLVAWCLVEREAHGVVAGWAALDSALVRAPGAAALLELWEEWATGANDSVRVAALKQERARWAPP